jgi:hypothetical protein
VEDQRAARHDVRRPAFVVAGDRLVGVAAVDEQHAERRTPERGHPLGPADDRDHLVLQARGGDRGAEDRQRVHLAEAGVDQLRVVVLPSRLDLLRAPVVVDGDDHGPGLPGRRAEVDGGLAAVGADLADGTARAVIPGHLEQGQALLRRHETLGVLGGSQQLRRHRHSPAP